MVSGFDMASFVGMVLKTLIVFVALYYFFKVMLDIIHRRKNKKQDQ